ncbi:MAG: FliM/FliN family flagellar motor switch protein [Vicinamibacterales bacterium]
MSSSPSSSSSSEPIEAPAANQEFAWMLDVPCPVDFVLGTAIVRVRDCVQFAPNSVVRLRQSAGADLEVRAGGVVLATGEVVMVDENVGLRLNKVTPPAGQDLS